MHDYMNHPLKMNAGQKAILLSLNKLKVNVTRINVSYNYCFVQCLILFGFCLFFSLISSWQLRLTTARRSGEFQLQWCWNENISSTGILQQPRWNYFGTIKYVGNYANVSYWVRMIVNLLRPFHENILFQFKKIEKFHVGIFYLISTWNHNFSQNGKERVTKQWPDIFL